MTEGYYAIQKLSRWQRLIRKLFPVQYLMPLDEPPPDMMGETQTFFVMFVDWRDRLRLLVSGRIWVEVRSATERDPGQVTSRSVFYVMAPGEKFPAAGA